MCVCHVVLYRISKFGFCFVCCLFILAPCSFTNKRRDWEENKCAAEAQAQDRKYGFEPHESEAKCKVSIMKISFHSSANKTIFRNFLHDPGVLLTQQKVRTKKTLGDRSFSCAAPRLWNLRIRIYFHLRFGPFPVEIFLKVD